VSVTFTAFREQARRWVRIQAVKLGVVCIHHIDTKAWRAGTRCHRDGRWEPLKSCGYCDQAEAITDGEFFALFGRHHYRGSKV
jgi:hypothetical protein